MALKKINPTQTDSWRTLLLHYQRIKNARIQDFFQEPNRLQEFTISWNNFYVDFSKNWVDSPTKKSLIALANECDVQNAIDQYFNGSIINETETRSVLHTALRSNTDLRIIVDGENVFSEVAKIKAKIKDFSFEIISGARRGFTNQKFTDIVNIGIGGSDLGPNMVIDALQFYKNHLNVHFISNVDGDHVTSILQNLNPATTLFIIVSKTFTTQETLTNSETIRSWFLQNAKAQDIAKHFVAVSMNVEKVVAFGINENNIFPMWDYVGGRFSLWSAVGLSIALGIGYENFEKLLAGASQMDQHFKETDFSKNIPVQLALISIWYSNFFNTETEAIIPYTQYLQKLAPYLQQASMESNGKSIDRNGQSVDYNTGSIIWGQPGTNSQHAFFQLMHQGTKIIPADFIGFTKPLHGDFNHHDKLMSNFFAQTEALMSGKNASEVRNELQSLGLEEKMIEKVLPFKIFDGNKPTTTILIDQLTPGNLGALIAAYEHKIFVQGVIWNIYSFDQWGVELGKQLATTILDEILEDTPKPHDASTAQLLKNYVENRHNKKQS